MRSARSVLRWLVLAASASAGAVGLPAPGPSEGATVRHVSRTDAGCGGHSPCYATIQAAIDVVQPGDTVQIQAGTYVEQVSIVGKNAGARSEGARVTIQADPAAAAGSVVLHGAVRQCAQGHAIRVQQSRFITIRGLTITGAGGAGIALLGGGNRSMGIRIERNRIVGNGGSDCDGGITVGGGNVGTLILNNVILANGGNGIATVDGEGGLHTVVQNTIHANGWNGLSATGGHVLLLVNNAITGNGTAIGSTGGRVGVMRETTARSLAVAIGLRNNLVCGNRLGELAGPVLDGTDGSNLTPTGSEGPGVSASPGCEDPARVYRDLAGPDREPNTLDDDPTPSPSSPLVDQGLDPRTLLTPELNTRFEADYYEEAARPVAGTAGGGARFDIGAVEASGRDVEPPMVVFQTPAANAHVRGAVSVRAQATDDDGSVAALTMRADGQPLGIGLDPSPPASPVVASASWNTSALADGVHTLTATATDQAGNPGSASRTVIVDNTPPETLITDGTAAGTTAVLRFTGSDNLTPTAGLTFAWRLDGGAYSSFAAASTASLSGLAVGAHVFEVKGRDQAGNEDPSPAARSFTVSALQITITEPAGDVTVPSGSLLVRGTVASGGAEVGITVNGVAAAVRGGSFAAVVPVAAPSVALTAVATTRSGETASHTVTVPVSDVGEQALMLRAHPGLGEAPLTAGFSLLAGPVPVRVEVDFDGDGQFDFDGPSLEGQTFTYASPGLYVARIRVTDAQGAVRTASTVVEALDRAALETVLQARWSALRAALAGNDVTGAVALFAEASRDAYRGQLAALAGVGALPQVAADLGAITAVKVRDRAAEYEMRATRRGVLYSFYVLFVVDTDGLWRLRVF